MKRKLKQIIPLDVITAIILGASILLALYVAVLTDCTMEGIDILWNPISAFIYIFQNGVSGSMVLMLFILFAGCGLYLRMNKFNVSDSLNDDRNINYSESDIYGTSGYLKSNELDGFALITSPEDAYGTILGQMDKTGRHLITTDIESWNNKHVAICGGSGAGKSRAYARPYIIQTVKNRFSLLVTDPKGELYEDAAQYMRDHGYIVRIFNIKNPIKSDSWNCLRELIGSDYRAQIFSSVVVENTSPPKDIWRDAKASLFKALCLRVVHGNDYGEGCEKGPKTMESVYKLITAGSEYLESVFDESVLAEVGAMSSLQPYEIYKGNSPNSRAAIVSSLGTALQQFQGRDVCKMTETDDIDLTLPAKKPCAYFCIMSDQHQTMDFFASLFFSFLFIDLVDYIDENGPENCVPVNFLLDEFPNIGTIPDFDRKIATVRSRNINISLIFQGIPQLQAKYPEGRWSTIIGNCDTVLFLGTGFDQETAKFFSARTGEVTVKVKTEQHGKIDPFVKMGLKHSTGDGKRMLMNPDEIIRLERDRCIIIFSREKVMRPYKYDYSLHPEAKNFTKCRIKDIPDIFDDEAREQMRREDDERVAAYEEYLRKNPPRTPNAKKKAPVNTSSVFQNIFQNIKEAIKDYKEKKSWKVCEKPAGFIEESGARTTMIREENPADYWDDTRPASESHTPKPNIQMVIENGVVFDKHTHKRVGILDGNKVRFDDGYAEEPDDQDDELLTADDISVVSNETWHVPDTEADMQANGQSLSGKKYTISDAAVDKNVASEANEEYAYSMNYESNAESSYEMSDNPDDFDIPDMPVEEIDQNPSIAEPVAEEQSDLNKDQYSPGQADDLRDLSRQPKDLSGKDESSGHDADIKPNTTGKGTSSVRTPSNPNKKNHASKQTSATMGCMLDNLIVQNSNKDFPVILKQVRQTGNRTAQTTTADIDEKMNAAKDSARGKRRKQF